MGTLMQAALLIYCFPRSGLFGTVPCLAGLGHQKPRGCQDLQAGFSLRHPGDLEVALLYGVDAQALLSPNEGWTFGRHECQGHLS